MRQTLGKKERIKSRKLISRIFAEGMVFQKYPLRALVLFSPFTVLKADDTIEARIAAGFTVSTRNFKKAVDRNRIKRLMKEVFRKSRVHLLQVTQQKHTKMEIFFIYTGKEMPGYLQVEQAYSGLEKKLLEHLGTMKQEDTNTI